MKIYQKCFSQEESDSSNPLLSLMKRIKDVIILKFISLEKLGLTFSSKLDCDFYIISIAKTASKEIGALIPSMKFLSPEVALYLYKSTIRP